MKKAFAVLVVLSSMSTLPAYSQACGDEGRYFHLVPPSYSVARHRRQALHRWAKALRWYREHNGNNPLCVNGKAVQ
jgi:hypothetical protein